MIQFKTSFKLIEFSCSLPDVEMHINNTRAHVTISVSHSGSTLSLFDENLYPDADNNIILTDLGRLTETVAEMWLKFSLTITVTEQLVDANLNVSTIDTRSLMASAVVRCRANVVSLTPSEFCNKHFLTLLDGTRVTSPGRKELLSYIGIEDAVVIRFFDDGSSSTTGVSPLQTGDGYVILDVSPDNFNVGLKKLVRYLIKAGSREQWYEVDWDCDPDISPVLLFTNSFGVQELAYCTGEHRQVSSFDRKQARIGKLKRSYDIEERETFHADTGILSFPMANWWRDVLRSRDIQVLPVTEGAVVVDGGKPVIITSEKAELSNEASHLPRFTFEYEYADRNHNIWEQPREGRIFDNTFDYTFN